MMTRTLVAITHHFLAARHLFLRHALSWQARKRGNGHPHHEQSEDDQ